MTPNRNLSIIISNQARFFVLQIGARGVWGLNPIPYFLKTNTSLKQVHESKPPTKKTICICELSLAGNFEATPLLDGGMTAVPVNHC